MKLVLGTVQLGLNYGINNLHGQPNLLSANEIIQSAIDNQINYFDTAQAYGNSETILGHFGNKSIQIITKLNPMNSIELSESNQQKILNATKKSIQDSLNLLQRDKLDVLLLHRWEHKNYQNGLIWKYLEEQKKKNLINQLGVSIQTLDEAIESLNDLSVDSIQLPVNILDWRWETSEFQIALKRRNSQKKIIIYARSIFLQGLLISNKDKLWQYITKSNDLQIYLNQLLNDEQNLKELCLGYVKSLDWIDFILIGVETLNQLKDNLYLFSAAKINQSQSLQIKNHHLNYRTDVKLLNPAFWPK